MRINMFLTDNIKVLAEAKAPVASWLAHLGTDPTPVYERVFRNPAGLMDWRMENGLGLYEKLNPRMLYGDWRPKDKLEGGATVIVGAGLGYGINHVLTGTPPSHKIVVVEPRPEMLLACLGRPITGRFCARPADLLPPDPALSKWPFRPRCLFFVPRINLRADLACKQMGPEYSAQALVKVQVESLTWNCPPRHNQEVMVATSFTTTTGLGRRQMARVKGMGRGLTGESWRRTVPAAFRTGPARTAGQGLHRHGAANPARPGTARHQARPVPGHRLQRPHGREPQRLAGYFLCRRHPVHLLDQDGPPGARHVPRPHDSPVDPGVASQPT